MNTTTNIIIPTDGPAAVITANTSYDNNDDDNDNDNEGDDDGSSSILDGSNSREIVVVDIDVSSATANAFSTSTSTSSVNSTSPTPTIPTSTPTSTSITSRTPATPPPLLLVDYNNNPPSSLLQAVKKIHIQRGSNDELDTNVVVVVEVEVVEKSPPPPSLFGSTDSTSTSTLVVSPGPTAGATAAAGAATTADSTSTSADSTSPTPNIPTPIPSTSPTPAPPILLIDNPPLQAVKRIHIERDNADEHEHGQQQQKQRLVPIISLNECIYGKRNDNHDDDDNDKHDNEASTGDNTATTAIPTSSHSRRHRRRRRRRHDIDISLLRKLCSTNGSSSTSTSRTSSVTISSEIIPEEEDDPNDHDPNDPNDYLRGVIWRIVLGQLPTNDIYNTWSVTLTTQRNLYQELISTYLNCSNDNPTSRQSTSIQTNQHEQEQTQEPLDASLDLSSICPPTIQTTTEDNEDNDNENENNNDNNNDNEYSNWSNASRYQESMYICLDEDIYNEFPHDSKYKELWKQSGITLNKGQSASAIGMNILQIPKELLTTDNANQDDNQEEDDDNQDDANQDCANQDCANQDDANLDDDNELKVRDDAIQDDAIQDDANQDYDDELKSSKISTSTRNDKIFSQYIRDARTLMEIRKDVVRTHPTLQFYTEPKDNLGIRRHAAIERILFIWAKLNGNLYVQGMNEIVGTIYYVLANDKSKYPMNNNNNTSSSDDYWSNYAECDTYYLFHNLMLVDDIRDVYHQDLDHESNPTGLHGRISNIELLIKKHDPVLYKHLIQNLNIDTSFYTIRWLTTLLSREFLLNDTIRLWDSMFSSTNKENFLRYFCATMVINIRSKLLCGDFGTCLKLLQNYPSKSGDGDGDGGDTPSTSISSIVHKLLESSRSLWIYESQITLACHKGGLSLNDALQMIKPPMNNKSNNGNKNSTIIMAYGLPGGIYDVSSTSTIIENASNVTGQVLDVLSTTATATVAASARITAVVPVQKNVSRMFGNAKRIFNNRYKNSNTSNNNNSNNDSTNDAAAATTTTTNSVDDDDNNNDNDGTAATTTNTNATSIIDDGWDIIDSIIGSNNEYLQHRRLIEDPTTTTTTSIGLVGVGEEDDDDDNNNRDCRRISLPSSPPSAMEFKTTTTASTSITDIGTGGPALLTNAKNRLWNRISGTPTAATAAAATSKSSSTNDSTTVTNQINSKNDRFWNRRGGGGGGSGGGR